MVIQTSATIPHWNYLLAIERSVEELSRYIEFDQRNFDCFSIEIARVLLACGSEVDVVCRQLCQGFNSQSSADKIGAYRSEIVQALPDIPDFEVSFPQFGLTLKPWDEWRNQNGTPFWWTAYNMAKHHRDAEYERANLKNMLNAVGGLFVMVLYLYKGLARQGELIPAPQLLHVPQFFGGITHAGNRLGVVYTL